MEKHRIAVYLPILILLTACGSSPAASTPTAAATSTLEPTAVAFQESLCQKISLEPTPDAKEASLFPQVSDEDHAKGPDDASMTIIEYGDYQ